MFELATSILAGSVALATPILFSSLGEIYDERAGVLNMGIEGIMALSAFVSLWVTFTTGSFLFGLLAGVAAGALVALLHGLATVSMGVNQLISGLLIYTMAGGIADFSYRRVTATVTPLVQPLGAVDIPGLSQIPIIGPFLFQQNLLVYFAFILAVVLGLILYRTTWGLKVRSVGENPQAADAAGIDVNRVRQICVILSGVMAGLGGASMTIGYLGIYQSGIVAGRGWIAIVVVIFARWSPYRAILGSWIFGLGYSIASSLIGTGVGVPSYFLLMLPYILALLFILLFHHGTKPPTALTVPFKRR